MVYQSSVYFLSSYFLSNVCMYIISMPYISVPFLKYSESTVKITICLVYLLVIIGLHLQGPTIHFSVFQPYQKSSIIVFATKHVRLTIAISLMELMLRIYSCKVTFVARSTISKYLIRGG